MSYESVCDIYGVKSSAFISECGRYRYRLRRRLTDDYIVDNAPTCVFVMLNPSTADAMVDDPTIRACCDFARRAGCHWLTVVNCYAWRSTDPKAMFRAEADGADIVGPQNAEHIRAACIDADLVICGWGKHATPQRRREVTDLIRSTGRSPMVLAVNADGSPKHPLYIKRETTPLPYGSQQ